jgi:thiamine biosynthesis protein ThiI
MRINAVSIIFFCSILPNGDDKAIISQQRNGKPLMQPIKNVTTPKPEDIIIDVRHPDDAEKSPLIWTNNQIISVPFFNISQCFKDLDKQQSYLLFCDKGIMSRLHADTLSKQGFEKVGVFTPN